MKPGDREGEPFIALDVVADGSGAARVLADGLEDDPERRVDDPLHRVEGEKKYRGDEHVVAQRRIEPDGQRPQRQRWTRNPGQPVVAAGERRPLVGDEVEHLVEAERQHDEVGADALDADVSDRRGRDGADERARGEHNEQRRVPVDHHEPGGVGGEPEERRLPEGQHPRVAEDQVQRHGGDREDPDLGRHHGTDEQRQQRDGRDEEQEPAERPDHR